MTSPDPQPQPPSTSPSPIPYQSPAPGRIVLRDDIAYILPMAIFLVFTQIGSSWPDLYEASYIAKTLIVPVALWFCWRYYTKIAWTHLWLGALVGVVGLVQWVGMVKLLVLFFQWVHASGGGFLDWLPVYGKIGINGVPFFVFNGRFGLSGAQEPEALLNMLDLAREEDAQRGVA